MLSNESVHAKTISKSDLRNIAQQLVEKVGPKVKNQDITVYGKESEEISKIPDGEQLLFRPRIGNLVYDLDILAIKQHDGVYISFYDLISVFDFSINYDEDAQTATGWFLREDWNFQLDIPQQKVISRDKEFTFNASDIYVEYGETYIRKSTLEEWFDMTYDLDLAMQYIYVKSAYPLPKVAQHHRNQRSKTAKRSRNLARLPRKDVDYDNFELNVADLSLRSSYRRRDPGLEQPYRNSASVAVEGEVLKHSSYTLANVDNNEGLHTVIARLEKESEDPTLLGPLKARSYSVGDTNVTRVPLTGSVSQEFGFNVSNNPLSNSDFETTDIKGDGRPGWDVELYRNGALVSSLTIDDTGRYLFDEIQLFGGENTFELFFYGPQGEIRTDAVNIPVNEALLSTQNNTYEFSASLSDKRTYQKRESNDEDESSPHLAGKYNFFLGDALSYVGFRSRQYDGEQKTFLGAGVTKILRNAIVDANIGVDDQGEMATELTTRTKFKDWNLALSGELRTDGYNPSETTDPRIISTNFSANKNYKPPIGTSGNISLNVRHSETESGIDIDRQRLSVSNSFGRLNLSNTILREEVTNRDDRLDNTLSMRYTRGKFFARGGIDYDIKPKAQVDKYFSQFSYRPTNKLTTDLILDHEPDRDFSEARVNVNYTHDKVRISPFLEIDSDNEIFGGVNLNANFVNVGPITDPVITSEKLIGRGLVSAFIYHDKNGDRVFNEGDAPLPEVVVESVNVKRRASSDEKGYSLIKGLPETIATDIQIDKNTLPDPFMIPATEGQSIFPRGGDIVHMEFPVHSAGEVDGTVTIQKKNGKQAPARLIRIQLIPTSGDLSKVQTARTAGDGFYVFPQVPPGNYLLTPSYDDLKKAGVGQPVPEYVSIGYDGNTIYGKNIMLSEHIPATPLKMKDGGSQSYVINIGSEGESRLSGLLRKMITRTTPSAILNRLKRITTDEEKERFVTPSGTQEESFETCQQLIQGNTPCEIEQAMLTTGK